MADGVDRKDRSSYGDTVDSISLRIAAAEQRGYERALDDVKVAFQKEIIPACNIEYTPGGIFIVERLIEIVGRLRAEKGQGNDGKS